MAVKPRQGSLCVCQCHPDTRHPLAVREKMTIKSVKKENFTHLLSFLCLFYMNAEALFKAFSVSLHYQKELKVPAE